MLFWLSFIVVEGFYLFYVHYGWDFLSIDLYYFELVFVAMFIIRWMFFLFSFCFGKLLIDPYSSQ